VDFTREPIVESVITPKEGCKLVIRSSKGVGQEEYFVDAVEIVSFGDTFFLRSLEKPKSFLVPATDYEILEVRETRLVLKSVGMDRSIKIGGGKEGAKRSEKISKSEAQESPIEPKLEPKRRERRRQYRKRRTKEVPLQEGLHENLVPISPPDQKTSELEEKGIGKPVKPSSSVLGSLLPPPPNLISDSIQRYKGNELFKDVFLPKKHDPEEEEDECGISPEGSSDPTTNIDYPHKEEKQEVNHLADDEKPDKP